jgi:hypothetical protein
LFPEEFVAVEVANELEPCPELTGSLFGARYSGGEVIVLESNELLVEKSVVE